MTAAMSNTPTLRVFFALWPNAEVAARLHAIARQQHTYLGGRISRLDTLHATLVFIGTVAPDRLPDLLAAAEDVHAPAFQLQLDQAGCWRHNHIAYLGVRQVPTALQKLQCTLAERVRAAGFTIDTRTYFPHVTLLRKAVCGEMVVGDAEKENPALKPVIWPVRDFVLVKSSMGANGSRYEQIGRWPLL
jgi:RNA 2',3'-cyclic 3'-phosphodiesterase